MDQDFLLIREMKRGNEEAMEVFVRKYYPQILKYCNFHCADRAQAEDLTQETFLHFFRALAGYAYKEKTLNYLYSIARNLCTDQWRKSREIVMEDLPETGEERMGKVEERLMMEEALWHLPEALREVLILRFFQELKIREIAKILDIGVPTVKYRLKKALAFMEQELGKEAENGNG
ncbi:MAG: RNA polymerase sigma factor [Lachnospiraceae bacterium]|nr:RNA polymerase sigma factor [Lachnospiraceae bacterium]